MSRIPSLHLQTTLKSGQADRKEKADRPKHSSRSVRQFKKEGEGLYKCQRELNKRGLILKEDHNEDMDHLGFDNRVLVKRRRTN